MASVICLGELLIDFCARERDVSLVEAGSFVKAPGGAPANVAAGVVRLGETAAFCGAVGADPFGEFLQGVLDEAGIDTAGLVKIDGVRTMLAFVAARSDGKKDICFYNHPGADMSHAPEHIDEALVRAGQVFHFGSISRIHDGARAATDCARRIAADNGAMITYDPNWRPTLWLDAAAARERLLEVMDAVHVAKVSDEEWEFLTGTADLQAGAAGLLDRGVALVIRSEGPRGASFATGGCSGHVDAFAVDCVDTLGAGDAFMACAIVELLAHWRSGVGPGELAEGELRRIVRRANAVGALGCTKVGAIPSLPTAAEAAAFLGAQKA